MQGMRSRNPANLFGGAYGNAQKHNPLLKMSEMQQAHLVQKDNKVIGLHEKRLYRQDCKKKTALTFFVGWCIISID